MYSYCKIESSIDRHLHTLDAWDALESQAESDGYSLYIAEAEDTLADGEIIPSWMTQGEWLEEKAAELARQDSFSHYE